MRISTFISKIILSGLFSLLSSTSLASTIKMNPSLGDSLNGFSSTTSRSLYWHEIFFDSQAFCNPLASGYSPPEYTFSYSVFHPDNDPANTWPALVELFDNFAITPSSMPLEGNYAFITPDIYAYSPAGLCSDHFNIENSTMVPKGGLTLGAKAAPLDSKDFLQDFSYVSHPWVYTLDDRLLLKMEYPVISSTSGRGPFAEATIRMAFRGTSSFRTDPKDRPLYFGLYYLNQTGRWTRASRLKISKTNGMEDFTISAQLPYDTVAQVRLETSYDSITAYPRYFLGATPYYRHLFGRIQNLRLLTETCVPDVISGDCVH